MTDVIIGYDRLAVVLAYLADKAPEGLVQRREWARCMAILSAQQKEAPGTTNSTPPPQYDPATVAFPAYVTHERELNEVTDSLSARMDALSVQLAELDKDHVDLVKCYVHHLREHMPEALRNAGEVPSITREELAGVDELRAEVVALAGEVTAQPGYFDAAIAKAIAAHEIAAAEHFQGQIDTLSRVVDEDRKAVVAHERELHPDAPCVRLARVIASAPKEEPKTCPTCHHYAVCRKSDICCSLGNVGCESWEGQHPK
jgi:hypothetical protein